MNKNIVWLRISYWAGIIIDALAAILLTFPDLMGIIYRLGSIENTPSFRSSNTTAAVLMWGWTFLLFWADRKPLERRGVLGITLIPVLAGMITGRILEVTVYQASLSSHLPFFILQISLILLFGYSLWINSKPMPGSSLQ